MSVEKIIQLTSQLYPTGRAFNLSVGTQFRNLHVGLAQGENEIFQDAVAIQDQVLPDNDNYTADDAATWEEKLQIPIAPAGVSLDDRKLAILRKLRYPGDRLPRQSIDFVEDELNAAGFAVKCYENKFVGSVDYIKVGAGAFLYKRFREDTRFRSGTKFQKIAVDQNATGVVISQLKQEDETIVDQSKISLRSTFIICGDPYPTAVNIPASRELEFRNLILTLKPAHTHAFLFVNYI